MSDRFIELQWILDRVRRRWTRRAWLRAWTLGAAASAAMLFVGLLSVWLIASEGFPLVAAVAIVLTMAIVAIVFALLPLRQKPSDKQIARFIEERYGGLDDVLVTAVENGATRKGPLTDLLIADAVKAAQVVDFRTIINRQAQVAAAVTAAVVTAIWLVAAGVFAPSAQRAGDVVGAYLFPKRYVIDVTPGSAKVRAGESVAVVARIDGIDGGLVPSITVGSGESARSARMTPGTSPGEFHITLNNISVSFPYVITVGAVRSDEYAIDVIRPVRVARIDVRYEYPRGVGLPAETAEDSGDIYAPAGTRAHLTITADKAIKLGRLTLDDGTTLPLTGDDKVVNTELTVSKNGSYRVALVDTDDLASEGGTEYFIRMLNDRPPEVRIMRPGGDKQVSPLEEVPIEARADDDYGLQSLELVIKSSAGKETVVPLGRPVSGPIAEGAHTVFLEDLKVRPGDFVTYHARARDAGRGRRPLESRSDIYFLEVKPYEEEFVASESQSMGGMQGQQTGLEDLIAQQKDIIAATWKLDARARRASNARSEADIRAVAKAQTAVKEKTEEVAADLMAAALVRRRRGAQPGFARPGNEDPIPRAIDAMSRAAKELERLDTARSLPFEEEALRHLLTAAAEIRRRQVTMQQAQGGGGNGNRQTPDLSTLFDQELRKRQQTNYETPSTSEARAEQPRPEEDPLAGIRELARRQEALAREQRELAKNRGQLSEDEIKRRLERLTRDQEELRRQAEELAQQLQKQSQQQASQNQSSQQQQQQGQRGQQSQQDSPSSQGGQRAGAGSRQLREISEEMKSAASDLQRQDPQQASSRGDRASQRLRELERNMQAASPNDRRRAIGDLQLEARQLADAQRRLGNEASRTQPGAAGEDARRRLAGEQERLAERTDRLGASVKELSKSDAEAEDRQAMGDAATEMDRQKIGERMRQSAQGLRQGQPADETGAPRQRPEESSDLARALDKVAERLGSATGDSDRETARLSEQLARTQELRDRLNELQRTMETLSKEADAQAAQQGQQGQARANGSQAGERPPNGQGAAEGGRSAALERLQREADSQLRDAQRLAEEVQRENPEAGRGTTPEQWQRSVSAPGTESFKQDFTKWESLKKNLIVALEQTESQLSNQLRARENRERLNAGRHDAVGDSYRELVDRYYQSLATPRRPVR